MLPTVPPDWRLTWLLIGMAVGLLGLVIFKAAERWVGDDPETERRVHERLPPG